MIDITGKKFNRLRACRFSHKVQKISKRGRDGYRYFWVFECECGKEKIINRESVMRGLTQSCGCFQKEKWHEIIDKHKMGRTRFYRIFHAMKQRCEYEKAENFSRYGGRGIKCLWKSFEEFRDDMHESYLKHVKEFGEKETSIDRIDVNKNYFKENCRWATNKEQQKNKR